MHSQYLLGWWRHQEEAIGDLVPIEGESDVFCRSRCMEKRNPLKVGQKALISRGNG